ncbi:OTU domain-containing protein 5-B-like isoform X1 [Carex littledalei]|uniref:ubiquitinyl hydrolase 1 n=1 Tax=Carex littledalei TaxID=544730 RepID=A0A833VCT1_9POAL|nr:OTU domain-containing protein 5-B-like isoform X1 [Carex littledalei]
MTRIFVPRGSGGSSSNPNRAPPSLPQPSTTAQAASSISRDEEQDKDSNFQDNSVSVELSEQFSDEKQTKSDELLIENPDEPLTDESADSSLVTEAISKIRLSDNSEQIGSCQMGTGSPQVIGSASYPPPPPVPPPKPTQGNNNNNSINNLRRMGSGGLNNSVRIGSSRRSGAWPPLSSRSSGSGSGPASPRSIAESDGYNSADEQGPCYMPSNNYDAEREHMFELELRRAKGFEIRRMLKDGNCLFRAVADQVYGDPEAYDMARQMCVDYMERERDHFSQFITENFTSYCKRKRRDKVYGNNMEIQAFAEMYNRPIHIYSYSTEPINIFQGSYNTDTPPIRLSYHHGNHYNSLVDPRRQTAGAGLGFSSLRGVNADRDQIKAAIKAQQEQQIDNALLAEGRFYSDLELTEKEIERMVMEASRAEYLKQQQHSFCDSSTSSGAEPSSSATTVTGSSRPAERGEDNYNKAMLPDMVLTGSMQLLLAMGFTYMQVIEAYSIFGDDVDSMLCYLLETGASSGASHGGSYRRKGKAAE